MRHSIGAIVGSVLICFGAAGSAAADEAASPKVEVAVAAATDIKAAQDHRTKTEQANEALLRRWYATVLGPLNPDPAPEFLAPDFVQHSKLAKPGIAGVQEFVRAMQTQWTQPVLTVEAVYADGDFVIGRVHQQRFAGDEGLRIVNIYRVRDGKFVEHWGTLQAPAANLTAAK